ncbi:MAG: DNA-directed RNA polymerase sigma-70 factor [Saprospiraceae bacterium]|nr:MAG: DNA-directed RNA polymerase sigma-70 factor [Saprospiraceae bacterium]
MDQLLKECIAGNRQAQKQLYEKYKDKMFVVCLRFANNRQDAEDLLQEGFIKVFRDLHQFNGKGSLEGWIRRVIVHTAIDYIRKQKNALEFQPLDGMANQIPAWEKYDPESEEIGQVLIGLMQKLPPGFRAVLNLHVLEGYTHEEIARWLGIAVGTSKSQLSRARQMLKKLFERSLTT